MAGSVTISGDRVYDDNIRRVSVLCACEADAATIPDTNLCALSGLVYGPLSGWFIYAIETVPGTTGPTDNTDMYLLSAGGTDLLGAAGENIIDNTAKNIAYLTNKVPIMETLTLDVNAQAVNAATYTIHLYLVKRI